MAAFTNISRWFGCNSRRKMKNTGLLEKRTRLHIEPLEDRLTPALQLLYGGAGTTLSLNEVSAGSDTVVVSEPVAGQLRIDLGTGTFAAGSSTAAGLTYQNAGSPTTSNFVIVNIATAFNVADLAIDLGAGSDTLALGLSNAAGGVFDITVTDSVGSDTLIDLNSIALQLGNLSITGGPIYVGPGVIIDTQGGDITINGTGIATEIGGILLEGGTLDAGGGNIMLTGTGAAGTSAAIGIFARLGAVIQTDGSGAVTLIGTGGNGLDFNSGVVLEGSTVMTDAGALTITGVGNGSGASNYGILADSPSSSVFIQAGSGNVTLHGAGGLGSFSNVGVSLNRGTQVTTTGDLDITGVGQGAGSDNRGIEIRLAALVHTGGSGSITLHGTGANGTDANTGVFLEGSGTQVTTANGNVAITGLGQGAGAGNYGVNIRDGALVQASGAGNLTLLGTGSAGADANIGVFLEGSGTQVTTADGDLAITGTGQGAGSGNSGIAIVTGALVQAGGSGMLTLSGAGGNGTDFNIGVNLGNAQLATAGGDLAINGVGNGSGTNNHGIFADSPSLPLFIQTGGNGKVTLLGTGGSDSDSNTGVVLAGAGTQVTTVGGNLAITGVGQGAGFGNSGILIANATVQAVGSGRLTLSGTGGNGTDFNDGVLLDGSATRVSTAGGNLAITGVGQGSGAANVGIEIVDGAIVQADGSGAVTLHGTGGNGTGSNFGVYLNSSSGPSQVIAATGALSITGAGQGASNGVGIWVQRQSALRTGAGNITLLGTGANAAGDGNIGVVIGSANSGTTSVTTTSGNIAITGVGQGTGSNSGGIRVGNIGSASGPIVQAGGTVTFNGTGTTGAGVNIANLIANLPTVSAGGALTITGTSTGGNGVNLAVAGMVGGDLSITGTGFSSGVRGGSFTVGGNVSIVGVATAPNLATGVAITNVAATGSGSITINGSATATNSLPGDGANVGAAITGSVTTASGAITIIGSTQGLDVNSAGVAILAPAVIQSGGSGALTIQGTQANSGGLNRIHGVSIFSATVQAGGALAITGSTQAAGGGTTAVNASDGISIQASIVTAGTTVTLAGTAIANAGFANAGVRIAVGGRVTAGGGDATRSLGLQPGSAIVVNFDQALALANGYQYVHVDGTVDLGGANLQATRSNVIPAGSQFLVLDNDLADAIAGMFAQGASVTVGNQSFALDYTAGLSDKDIVATAAEALSITTAGLPSWTQGVPFPQAVSATGGTGVVTFAVTAGTFPTGLALNPDGNFSGTPSAAGMFTFTITATDSLGVRVARTYTNVVINAPLSITTARLPNAAPCAPYRPVLASTGGTGLRTYAVTSGRLPSGLTLNSNGAFGGRPTVRGRFTFTITATDSVGGTAARTYTLAVTPAMAATFRFVRQPSHAQAGNVLTPVVLQLTDRFGNAIARAGVAVTLRLSGGRLIGTVTRQTDAHGRVSFGDLRIVPPGYYRLTAVAAGLTPATSLPLTIGPNPGRSCFWA